jgi:SlyX protein
VEDLSDMVARQGREIEGLERRVRVLLEREAARDSALGETPEANVRPPHW